MRLIAIVGIVLSCAVSVQSQKLLVAVSDLTAQGVEASSASIITDRLRNEMFNTGVFTVLERGQMEEILKEQGFQKSGCTSDACAVEIGQLLGVQFLVVGSIGKIGQTFTINARLIDVSTGKVTTIANTDCKCAIDLILSKSTVEIANKLAKGAVVPKTAAVPKPEKPQETAKPVEQKEQSVQEQPASAPAAAQPAAKPAKKKSWVPKVVFGVAAIGLAAAGIAFDQMAGTSIKNAQQIQSDYQAGGSNLLYADSKSRYQDNIDQAKNSMTIRNVMYVLSGVAVVGFGVSFAF